MLPTLKGKIARSHPYSLDKTLTVEGTAAEANATGEAIEKAKSEATQHTDAHANNKSNPHGVSKKQLGLENVDNTSDKDKPVSDVQAASIADAKKAGTDAKTAAQNAQTSSNEAKTAANNAQTSANEAKSAANNAQKSIDNHTKNTNNPHGVTAAQIEAAASFSSIDDCDVYEYGKHKIKDTTANTPSGGAISGNVLFVIPWDKNTGVQLFFDVFHERIYIRAFRSSKGFSEWEECLTTINTFKKLWENASIGSEFPAQSISVDLSSYRFILLEYKMQNSMNPSSRIIPVGQYTKITEANVLYEDGSDKTHYLHRALESSKDTVYFYNGYFREGVNVVNNNVIKPYRIYGII